MSSPPKKQIKSPTSPPKEAATEHSNADGQKLIDLWNSPLKLKEQQEQPASDSSPAVSDSVPHLLPDEEARRMLTIQELLFQDRLLMKDREWDEKFKQFEKEFKQLQSQNQALKDAQQEMRQVVIEYEKTMSQVIADTDKDKQALATSLTQVKKERDQALEDLQNVETAFGDLHRRYEKTKVAVEGFRKNEEILTNCVAEYQSKVKKQADLYEILKARAEERLESAGAEIDNVRKTSEAEIAALRAQLKKAEMKIESLENSLEQKTKENVELTNICDELIARVGKSS